MKLVGSFFRSTTHAFSRAIACFPAWGSKSPNIRLMAPGGREFADPKSAASSDQDSRDLPLVVAEGRRTGRVISCLLTDHLCHEPLPFPSRRSRICAIFVPGGDGRHALWRLDGISAPHTVPVRSSMRSRPAVATVEVDQGDVSLVVTEKACSKAPLMTWSDAASSRSSVYQAVLRRPAIRVPA